MIAGRQPERLHLFRRRQDGGIGGGCSKGPLRADGGGRDGNRGHGAGDTRERQSHRIPVYLLSFVNRRSAAGGEAAPLASMRWLVLGLLTIGMLGTGADLLLLDHYEGIWQLPPLLLIVGGLVTVSAVAARASAGSIAALRWTMMLFIAAGLAGMVLHFNGNREFQREMDPVAVGMAARRQGDDREGAAGPGPGVDDSTGSARIAVHLPAPRAHAGSAAGVNRRPGVQKEHEVKVMDRRASSQPSRSRQCSPPSPGAPRRRSASRSALPTRTRRRRRICSACRT